MGKIKTGSKRAASTQSLDEKVHARKNRPPSRISEAKNLRADVQRQTRRSHALRTDLLAIATHDLRNPLGVVLVTSTLLARELTAPNQLEQVAAIRRAAMEMIQVIDDLVDGSQIDAGALDLLTETSSLAGIIEEAAAAARAQKGERAIAIETRVESQLPEIHVDRQRLLQVVSRIVTNALRFMPKDGKIFIECRKDGPDVRFSVRDSGPLIPESQRPYAFMRRPPAGRRSCRGTGLGMFVVKGIVEAHGGSIELTSDEERGNRVSFTLPMKRVMGKVAV
ncbi:MAG TPA: HAMP domain-containing sensor histidine kinase [Polyangium sp.]|nr:HAMP domain-containing sensor histidine kinase [Polyangium sp.]